MSDSPVVGLLHPGQMGVAVGLQALRGGAFVLWCADGRSRATAERARSAGLTATDHLAELLERADVVLSVCPPAVADDVLAGVVAHGFTGVYVEANAVSPARSLRLRDVATAAGMRFVDGGIIGPPPGDGATARLYLAGEAAPTVAALFEGSRLEPVILAGDPPAASALKMAYASYQKASRVLAATAHALAREHGVGDQLVVEGQRLDGSALADVDHLPGVAARAWRWAPELRDVAAALDEAGLPDGMAAATAAILDRWEPFKDRQDVSVEDVLDRLSDN